MTSGGDSRGEAGTHPALRANLPLILPAAIYFFLEWLPSLGGTYGYHIDELYYLACADHLAFGYVDHPPLSIFLLYLIRGLLGDSLPALRLLPALAGGATVFLTALIARRLGAGSFGQFLAALSMMVGLICLVLFSLYSMNAISVFLWAFCFLLLVEIEKREAPRLWIWFGVMTGLAMENKHTFVLLLFGLAVGILVTRARRHLAHRQVWIGAGVAALLLLPNLLWQIGHAWPSLEFYRNADIYKNVPTPPLEVVKQQILFMNPATFPISLAGIYFFLISKRGRAYRHLGWLFVTLLALMIVGQKSRPDRITPAYVIVFAGGSVLVEEWLAGRIRRWLRWLSLALFLIAGATLAPIALPILSPETTARYAARLGIVPQIERGEGKQAQLPQWLADRFGWEKLAADVTEAANRLGSRERNRAVIFAPSYGQAGAIERFGRGNNLPPVYAFQNSYHSWGPPPDSIDVAIIVGPIGEEAIRELFEEGEFIKLHDCDWCMP